MAHLVFDAAQYIIEPKDLFTKRVAAKHKDKAPKVVNMPDGGEGWAYNGGDWLRPLGLEVAGGHSPIDIKAHGYSYADIRKGQYDAKQRLADMKVDEIDMAMIYPTYALDIRNVTDPELHLALIQAYNDGVWDWSQEGDGKRLIPQAMLPVGNLEETVKEVERVAKKGFRGVVFNGFPQGTDGPQAEDDRFFAALQDHGIVLDLLRGGPVGAGRVPTAPKRYVGPNAQGVTAADPPIEILWANHVSIKNQNIAWIVLNGITERFPNLHITLVDAGAGWIRTTGELLDWNYRYAQWYGMPKRLEYVPSDYVKRNFKATLKDERFAVIARKDLGDEYLLWASNYPNSSTSWPNSGRVINDALDGVAENERAQILGTTAATWYKVPVPAMR